MPHATLLQALASSPVVSLLLLLPHALLLGSLLSTWRRAGLRGLYKRLGGAALGFLQCAVPGVGALVEKEVAKELAGIQTGPHMVHCRTVHLP